MKKLVKILLILVVLSFTSCKIREKAFAEGFNAGQKVKYTDLVRKYYSDNTVLKFNNQNYKHNLNVEQQVNYLSSGLKDDFEKVVYNVNQDILKGLSHKLNLTEKQKQKVLKIYDKSHKSISKEYYLQYIQLSNMKELNRKLDNFIPYTYYERTASLAKVMSSQLCSTIGFIIGALNLEYPSGNIAGILSGAPCVSLSTELLQPMMNELLERGFIKDISTSKIKIERKLSNMIVELASVEKHYNAVLNVKNEVETFFGLFSSTANVTVEYYGIIKAGYNLGDNFELRIDYTKHRILIIIDEPKIFEPIIYPVVRNINNGWFAEIDENTLNSMQVKAMNKILNKAQYDNILYEAEKNAKYFLHSIFAPIANIPPKPFTVEIISREEMNKLKIQKNNYIDL